MTFADIDKIYEHADSLLRSCKYEFEMLDAQGKDIFSIHSYHDQITGWVADKIDAESPNSWMRYNEAHPDLWDRYELEYGRE